MSANLKSSTRKYATIGIGATVTSSDSSGRQDFHFHLDIGGAARLAPEPLEISIPRRSDKLLPGYSKTNNPDV